MELARIAIGLPVAAAFPLEIPTVNASKKLTIALTATYSFIVLFPLLPSWLGFLSFGITIGASFAIRAVVKLDKVVASEDGSAPWGSSLIQRLSELAGLFALIGVIVAILFPNIALGETLGNTIQNDQAIIICSGYLGATFFGDLIVSHAVGPLLANASGDESDDAKKLKNAGAHIGWIERAIFFPLFAGGVAAAAAIAFTAKSLVRLPSIRKDSHNMAEYVLVGSMLSALVAMLFAIMTRLALGMSPI
ncbi:hypothetical protein [Saccharopolyspora elongata]|uniref:Uncharacterized protein n=1 Tax=Saccharopolyspora elongata TaxID=2530387 RepID=A0A4R4YRQ9_9PSEU|nr:hypothetical protein [Saccharopolyspora elongata]TDD47948.1 hypothetical protein E1288_23655 [Saccharopolyspora elongata]